MRIIKCIHSQSNCFKNGGNVTPVGIVVHSTGANNAYIKRYSQPSDNTLNRTELLNLFGVNQYGNHWNRPGVTKAVHYIIGKLADGSVATVYNIPEYMECWGCGKGSNGSYNYAPVPHIQFEVCEDDLKDETYFNAIYKEATELCADICDRYKWKPNVIVSHKEAHDKGYASNHRDIDHWLKLYGKTMNDFRKEVQRLLDEKNKPKEDLYEPKVGDIVNFIGNIHYPNANSDSPNTCVPGIASVTRIYNGKHPYHLINTAGNNDGVHGWVDAEFIRKYDKPIEETKKEEEKPAVEVVPEPEVVAPEPAPAPEIEEDPTPTIDPKEDNLMTKILHLFQQLLEAIVKFFKKEMDDGK